MPRLLPPALAALALALVALPAAAQVEITDATCRTNGSFGTDPPPTVPNGHIAWPADDPVWEFDVYRPANRTTVNGGGLEIRDVTYRGRYVLARANVPVLNVEYDEGGCGCFRDWQTTEAPMEIGAAATMPLECVATSAPGDVVTACEANVDADPNTRAGDVGDFTGIAIEDYGDELVLTSHTSAGWYRYRMKWHFYADGRIWPEFSFAAADAVCTETAHRHHAYWRFDFDLDGTPTTDVVREHTAAGGTLTFAREASRVLAGPSDPTYWSVVDDATGIGYEIRPSEADRALPVDAYSKADALVLRYKVDEIEDGVQLGSGCAIQFEPFLDDEALEGEDSVFWYRAGALHEAGNPYECDIVGPMLHPVGFSVTTVPGTENVEFEAARPNPFTGSTTLRFRVESAQPVVAELYDLAGRRLAVLFDGAVPGGAWQTLRVDGRALPAGTYVVRLRGETARGSTRVVLVR